MEKWDTIVIVFRETVERPEIKQKENIERRTLRAAPEGGREQHPLSQPGAINAGCAAAEHSPVPNPEFYELSKTEEESTRREGFAASVTSWAKEEGVSAQEEILFDPCTGAYPSSTGNIGLCINFKLQPFLHMSTQVPGWCFLSAGQPSLGDELPWAPLSAWHAKSRKNNTLCSQERDS